MERQYEDARRGASGLHAAHEELRRAEQERERRSAAQQEAALRTASRVARRDTLDRERAMLEEELAQARGGAESVAVRTAQLERQTALLTETAEAARAAEDTAQRLKDADARLAADAAYRAGFDTPRAAADRPPGRRGPVVNSSYGWTTGSPRRPPARAALAEPDTVAAAQQPPADLAGAEQTASAAARRLRETPPQSDAAANALHRAGPAATRQAVADVRRLAPLRGGPREGGTPAGLAAGTSAENERRMRLESYVLAARLEQVAAAASARAARMSAGRYSLVHSDGARPGAAVSGLGLHVIDAWTGAERDTATLSGGETFSASLALALGLADVVTDEAGGTRLETLFIDEGFGSLDDQTLDEILDVLDSLRERDRCVGIVSHVADLRQRIPVQLEVVKGRSGSVVRQRGGE